MSHPSYLGHYDASRDTPQETVIVQVDKDNIITRLSSGWDQAAADGQAADSLAQNKVIGLPLRHFITSDTTRMYVESCLKLCRLRQQVLYRPYRCDSPTHKRFLELQLTPLAEQAVEMKHFLLKEEPFERPVSIEDITNAEITPAGTYVRCSFCNRLKSMKNEHWTLPEQVALQPSQALRVIHSVCPDCKDAMWHKRTQAI